MYGDCKDRAALVSAIAKEHDIDVNMAVVTRIPYDNFDLTHPGLYNHVICAFSQGDSLVFFDPTSKYTPYGYLPEGLINKKALILNDTNPRYVVINNEIITPSVEMEIDINLDSLVPTTAKIILRNNYKETALWISENSSAMEFENSLEYLITSLFYKISLDNFKKVSENTSEIIYSVDCDMSDYIISSRKKKYIPQIPFAVYDIEILDRSEDDFPIHFEMRQNLFLKVKIKSNEWKIVKDSFKIAYENNSLYNTASEIIDSSSFEITYEFKQNMKKYENDEKKDFLIFTKDYISRKKHLYTLKRRED
jgi:hypothetical protein